MARSIQVEILGDSSSLEKAFARSSKEAKKFNQDLARSSVRAELGFTNLRKQALGMAGGYLAVGTAASLAGRGLQSSVDAASNLNEQISKAQVVFGDSSAAVEKWSRATSAIGIARDEALEAAGTFGNLFTTVGIGQKANAEMSRSLVELAADLGSFNNTSSTDALDALRSGLIGEAEPLRRYGVLLSEARVQQEAMNATGKRNARALTDQEKALARYRIILRDTVTAQGNFKETSDDLAQQQKKLKAEFRNLSIEIGNVAVPKLTGFVGFLNDTVVAGQKTAGVLRRIGNEIPLPDPVKRESVDLWKEFVVQASPVGWIKRTAWAVDQLAGSTEQAGAAASGAAFQFSALNMLMGKFQMPAGLTAKDKIELRGLGAPKGVPGGSVADRNQWFDTRIGREIERAQDLGDLRKAAAQIQARIKVTKDITRRLNLEDQLWRVNQEILSRQALSREQAADAAKQRQRAAAEAARIRSETAMGWLEFAAERAEATEGIRDDLKAYRAIENALKKRIQHEGRTLELARDLWRVQEQIRNVGDKFDSDPLAGLKQASTKQMLAILSAGTGLRGVGLRTLAGNIAGAQMQPITIQNTIELDGEAVGRSVTKTQARTGRRTAQQTSGRRG